MSVIGGQENKSKLEEQKSLNDKLDKTSWRKKSENVMTIICFPPLILWLGGGLNRSWTPTRMPRGGGITLFFFFFLFAKK